MSRALKGTLDHRQQLPRLADGFQQIGEPVSPYLRTDEAARYLRFRTPRLFREWANRHNVPAARTGRTLLYSRHVLDAFVERRAWTLGRGQASAVEAVAK